MFCYVPRVLRPDAPDETVLGAQDGPDPRRWKALAVLLLVQFMLILDVSVVNIALPTIREDLGFSDAGLAWVVDGSIPPGHPPLIGERSDAVCLARFAGERFAALGRN